MKLQLEKVILHNFLSYGHSEIDLTDRGYCLVSGINRCSKDNAVSNGSGKSSWSSGICWALTGETVQGLKTGIKNIYADKNDDCYVTLFFKVDNDEYEVTRYREGRMGSDLKIKLNGTDISGKGIKESELVLGQYLPDLTSELIGSVIILGQGLPYKFTANKPSGRKEVLEKLSKSDFMIEDIKNRITQRLSKLNGDLRTTQDTLLSYRSKKSVYETQLQDLQDRETELLQPKDFDKNIKDLEVVIERSNKELEDLNKNISTCSTYVSSLETKLNDYRDGSLDKRVAISNKYQATIDEYKNKIFSLESDLKSVKRDIEKIESIKDVCPTCGRPFEGITKPDVKPLKEKLSTLVESLNTSNKNLRDVEDKKSFDMKLYDNEYNQVTGEMVTQINTTKAKIREDQNAVMSLNSHLRNYEAQKSREEANKANHLQNLEKVRLDIKNTKDLLNTVINKIDGYTAVEKDTSDRVEVVNKMKTLVQRDFRGFLLSNVIDFINKKSKQYSMDIFGTDQLDFVLDGNEINISYCNKAFENLSGGEKQKVDLIVQFAIRDMMSQYLDFRSNILVLDEITDNLDSIGCTNVLNLISSKLNDVESIFIVSHHSDELQIPADSEMVVVKNEEGISSIQ